MKKDLNGFTLIEALAVIAALAVLIGVAIPAYLGAMSNTRVTALQATLFEHVALAMRHAIVAGTPVVLCASQDGEDCGQGSAWSAGWIAFADTDRDSQRGAGDPIIQRQGRLEHGLRMTGAASRSKLVFLANGSAPGSNTTFTLCDAAHGHKGRAVLLANSGRLRKDTATPEATAACKASAF